MQTWHEGPCPVRHVVYGIFHRGYLERLRRSESRMKVHSAGTVKDRTPPRAGKDTALACPTNGRRLFS